MKILNPGTSGYYEIGQEFREIELTDVPNVLTSLVAADCRIWLIFVTNNSVSDCNFSLQNNQGKFLISSTKIMANGGTLSANALPVGVKMKTGFSWLASLANCLQGTIVYSPINSPA